MKKLFTTFIIALSVISAKATIHVVSASNFTFAPSAMSVTVGDTVRFTQTAGGHNTVSVSVPAGAATWNHNFSAGDFDYKVTVAGNYGYECTFHNGMVGGFVASDPVADVSVLENNIVSKVYPNPFKTKVNITHRPGTSIEIVSLLGEQVRVIQIAAADKNTSLDLSDLKKGVYFYVVKYDNQVVETKRIVKSE